MEYRVAQLSPRFLRMLGRSGVCAEGSTCDYSATGAILALSCEQDGTAVEMTFVTDADVYFTVFVDGARLPERLLVKGNTTASTGDFVTQAVKVCVLSAGEHVIRVIRQSNFWHARTALQSITTEATFLPVPPARARTFEFIGDSLTCGYGVTADAAAAPREIAGMARFCDATVAHAFLTAEALDAECIICGYSGWGLLWGDSEKDEMTGAVRVLRTIPQVYPFLSHRRGTGLYEPKGSPDLVVVNLGSNDASHKKALSLTEEMLIEAVIDFMLQIRQMYGKDMPIVQAYGFDHREIMDTIAKAVEQAGGEAAGFYYCPLPENGEGGNGHPSAAGQRAGADVLIRFLQEKGLV